MPGIDNDDFNCAVPILNSIPAGRINTLSLGAYEPDLPNVLIETLLELLHCPRLEKLEVLFLLSFSNEKLKDGEEVSRQWSERGVDIKFAYEHL